MGAETALLGALSGGAASLNPVGMAASATQFGIGALQTLLGGIKAKKAQKELENMKSPMYSGSRSINNYYGEALNRYNTNPYQSAQYNQMMRSADRNASNSISALQDRRGALASIGAINAATNDAGNNAILAAERERNSRFGQLGGAAQMKTADDFKKFEINQQQPFERSFQLKAMKAAANNQTMNAGIQNAFNGIGNMGMSASQKGGGGSSLTPAAVQTPLQGVVSSNRVSYKPGMIPSTVKPNFSLSQIMNPIKPQGGFMDEIYNRDWGY